MNWIAIINFLLIAGAIQGFIFFLVTFLFKKKVGPVILYLNLTVLFISLNNLQAWLIDNDYSFGYFYLKHMLIPWYLLVLPFFYSFLVSYFDIQERKTTFLKPVVILLSLELLIRTGMIGVVWFGWQGQDVNLIYNYTAIEEIVNAAFSLFIFIKSMQLVFRDADLYRKLLSYDDIKWIKLFLILGCSVFVLWIIAIIGHNTTGSNTVRYPLRLATSILLYWIGYQGLFRYTIVQDRILLRKSFSHKFLEEDSYKKREPKKSEFINNKHHEAFENIQKYIVENQKYLDPILSLEKLADELSMSTSHMSKLINTYSGQNFSDYINELRVDQSKKLLSDNSFSQYTIVAIGLECGFNSKSTFYAAFKKFTGLTPTDFRSQHS